MYQKVGKFGFSALARLVGGESTEHQGDQIRGYGFTRDGAFDTLARDSSTTGFTTAFNPGGFPIGAQGDIERHQVEQFILAFPSNHAPIVGQQVTLGRRNEGVAGPRIDLLRQRADAGECELVAKSQDGQRELGFLYVGGAFVPNRAAESPLTDAALRERAGRKGLYLTYTCVPLGSGKRIAIDRDEDGVLDGDEDRHGHGEGHGHGDGECR
jgi:hypothetical protein